jgi:hypothetical protein
MVQILTFSVPLLFAQGLLAGVIGTVALYATVRPVYKWSKAAWEKRKANKAEANPEDRPKGNLKSFFQKISSTKQEVQEKVEALTPDPEMAPA